MEQLKLSYTEVILYVALLGLVIGFLLGLIPLILGIKKGKKNYGYYGIVASALLGLLSPILSIIAVAVFTWLILRKTEPAVLTEAGVANKTTPVENSEINSDNL